MSNKISIRSTWVLLVLALLSIVLMWTVENTKIYVEQEWREEKIKAATLMQQCMQHIKNEQFGNEVAIDNINDPNETGLIGQQFTEITSGRGSLPAKLSTTNPNFAAIAVQLLKDAGLQKGDVVALSFTGSFPAVNIAVCAAVQTLELQPRLICSVTSSSWGANDPEFTWLDMHQSLYQAKLIHFVPLAASIGGNEDIGRTLSNQSRNMAEMAIERNNIPYINQNSLESNVKKRMEMFAQDDLDNVKVYLNVGGGIASFGSNKNTTVIPTGLKNDIKIKDIPDRKGTLFQMVLHGIPVINFLNQRKLLNKYDFPIDPVPLPPIGEGELYSALSYDLRVVGGATLLLSGLLLTIIYIDKKNNRLGSHLISNSETI